MDNHTLTVTIPFGKLGDIFDWCQHNCTGEWHFANLEVGGQDAGHYVVSFSNENDCNFFAMRWM
jgi:hypothetical protein